MVASFGGNGGCRVSVSVPLATTTPPTTSINNNNTTTTTKPNSLLSYCEDLYEVARLGLRGITEAFRDQVWVDFEGLGPGLIAIVGENGVGKSTLIGSAFAALFRQLPGQKRSLYDFCTHPEPEIDLAFSVNGEQDRSLLKLDPQSRQMESYVFDSRGIALVNGKKEAFAEWISGHVGSSRLFLASLYSSQTRTGNFLGLERTQRKELFITELLGLDRLRLIAATAKGFAEQAASKVVGLEGERRGGGGARCRLED